MQASIPFFPGLRWTISRHPVRFYASRLRVLLTTFNLATSVYVERQFSRGRLLISSVRNRLSAQSIRELMCLGCWSRQGFVEDEDFKVVAQLPTVEEGEEDDD